ncbi:Mur ligase family protein [Methanobacterium sp. MBAC-LM]|uniref:Mur ligase family protein n=1 Tax=Methanobacterium sp. MBAC-LM TaxID=3412034 RepID=UPI003C784DA1
MKEQEFKAVVIGGCGTVGSLMARVLKDNGADVTVSDLSTDSPQINILEEEGIKLNLGEHDENILKNADVIVVAPSLLQNNKLIGKIKSVTDADIISADEILSTCKVSKPVVGITGTNGKTTTTWMLKNILNLSGYKTPEHKLKMQGNTELIPSFQARLDGDIAVLEIGTHGNTDEIKNCALKSEVGIGIITNISKDHLSGSHNFQDYISCKREIVDVAGCLIFNADDPVVTGFSNDTSHKIFFYGIEGIDSEIEAYPETRECPICGKELEYSLHYLGHLGVYKCSCGFKRKEPDVKAFDVKNTSFKLVIGSNTAEVKLKQAGIHNVYNALAAASGASALNIDFDDIVRGIESFEGVKGRFQKVDIGKQVIIDYAHNPAGVKAIIQTLIREKPETSRLIVVNTVSSESGITGDIEIAKILKDADVIVVASNASRKASSEINVDNYVILTECSKKASKIGTLGASKAQVEESLNLAVNEAKKEDIILIIGEGGVKYSSEILGKFKN